MRRSVLWMRKRTMHASARIIEGTMQVVRALDEEENDAGEFGPHIFLCLFLADPFLTLPYLFDFRIWSRQSIFPSEGSWMSSVEWYNIDFGEWKMKEGLPRYRAGCVGFLVPLREGEEEEFWVMGGYGDYRTVSGVVPANVNYRDAMVLGLRSGKWREVGDMWEEGERRKLGSVVVVDGEESLCPNSRVPP